MTTERKHRELPECPSYVAHPQSVWFHCHWRPIIEELKAENEKLIKLMSVQLDMLEQNKKMSEEIEAWKIKNNTLNWDKVSAEIAKLKAQLQKTNEMLKGVCPNSTLVKEND